MRVRCVLSHTLHFVGPTVLAVCLLSVISLPAASDNKGRVLLLGAEVLEATGSGAPEAVGNEKLTVPAPEGKAGAASSPVQPSVPCAGINPPNFKMSGNNCSALGLKRLSTYMSYRKHK